MFTRRFLASLFVAMLSPAVARPSHAHRPQPQREVVIQIDERGGVALWRIWLKGPQASALRLAHDRDHDGALSKGETTSLAAALLARAMAGVELRWDGKLLRPLAAQAQLEPEAAYAGGLAAAGITKLELDDTQRARHHRIEARLLVRSGPLAVVVQTLGDWRVVSSQGVELAGDGRGLAQPVELAPGGSLVVKVRRVLAGEALPPASSQKSVPATAPGRWASGDATGIKE